MNRIQLKDKVWLDVVVAISQLGTCQRRRVACVLLDRKFRVLASGYNGTAPGDFHCIEHPCLGAGLPSGTGLEACVAIHAEQNAISQCKFPDDVHYVYSTASPCIHCVKLLATTGAKEIIFRETYPHSDAKDYWEDRGGIWTHVP